MAGVLLLLFELLLAPAEAALEEVVVAFLVERALTGVASWVVLTVVAMVGMEAVVEGAALLGVQEVLTEVQEVAVV